MKLRVLPVVAALVFAVLLGVRSDTGAAQPPGVGKGPAVLPVAQKVEIKVEEAGIAVLEKAVNDQKGKVVLVDFWATWCPPCVKKFPSVVALHAKHKDAGLAVVTVSLDSWKRGYKIKNVLKFLTDQKAVSANYVADVADKKALTKQFGLSDSIPYLTLYDRGGKRIWDSDSRELTEAQLAELVESEVKKAAPKP